MNWKLYLLTRCDYTESGEGVRLSPPAFRAGNNWNAHISSAQNAHRGRCFCTGVKYSPVTPVLARDMCVLCAPDAQQHVAFVMGMQVLRACTGGTGPALQSTPAPLYQDCLQGY